MAVLLVARHEPAEVLEQTIITLLTLDYPNKKVYFLDGSTDEKFLNQDRELCNKYGVIFFQPPRVSATKAGTINQFLGTISEKYVAVFDADQNPMPNFLKAVVPIAEYSGNIAFVQTPQLYSNIDKSNIARGSALQQSVFYESICEAKGSVNAMFCCGTNVLIRRDVLLSVGGFDESSVTEDFSTSFKMHLAGYRSIYYNHVRVFGMAPENLHAYFKQQARWSSGTAGVMRRLFIALFTSPGKLSLGQWWEYLLSSTYYFVGWSFFLLMIFPISYLIFGIPIYFSRPEVYLLTFVPYYVMSSAVFYSTMKNRNYRFKDVYYGIILASLGFPILMVSTLKGLFGLKNEFAITPKDGQVKPASFTFFWPWMTMIALNAFAIGWGAMRMLEPLDRYAIGVNIFWCTYHIFVLSQIYFFNKVKPV